MQKKKGSAFIWLRNDLRINDHYALYHATQKYQRVVAYYSFDPALFKTTKWGFKKTERYRAQFLIESVLQLQKDLEKLNITLIIEHRNPVEGIVQWIQKLNTTHLYFQSEWTSEERQQSEAIKKQIEDNIEIHQFYDQFLFHPNDIPIAVEDLPEVFTVFRKKCEKHGRVRLSLGVPSPMEKTNLLNVPFKVPTLETLGLESFEKHPHSAFPFEGGSAAAHQRLAHYFWKTKKLSFYKQTRNGLLGIDYSSKLSAWLANGSLSPREIYWAVRKYEKEVAKNQSTYWLIFELIWRDYFKYISLKHSDKIFHLGGILEKNYHWKNSQKAFRSWCEGTTAEPFVNANMIELNKTGWMSNRGRQNVGSFLAKNMLLDWRMGAAHFESMLIDYDVHSNYGNWMYVSGVGNDPRDRKFNVRWQAERYDTHGKFQQLWNQKTLFE